MRLKRRTLFLGIVVIVTVVMTFALLVSNQTAAASSCGAPPLRANDAALNPAEIDSAPYTGITPANAGETIIEISAAAFAAPPATDATASRYAKPSVLLRRGD